MIRYKKGNLLESDAQALVNTVNTIGVMGKGIALQFKKTFPNNYKAYLKACKEKNVKVGELFLFHDNSLFTGKKLIINFPTKTDWRKPSEYSYIKDGLSKLKDLIVHQGIESIAIPPLGAGNGGLNWNRVKQMMEEELSDLSCNIEIFQPDTKIKEILLRERIKLTPARAMLLSVLYDLVNNGEFVSEFAAEKVAYFLQKNGAKDSFKLEFKPYFYGPYSGKVRHVLYYLNGSYITGYSSKDKKPFEELGLIAEAEADVNDFLNKTENLSYKEITVKTKSLLQGFYSPFGLELLSSVDYLRINNNIEKPEEIIYELDNWSKRKKTLFHNTKFIDIALEKLKANSL